MKRPLVRIGSENVGALIPAYREGRHIGEVVRRTLCEVGRVLVVDDGSDDDTEARARAAGADVIRHGVNQGKGAAIKTGLRALGARDGLEYVLLLDGDGQHLPEEIPRFYAEANRSHAPMIVGNRMSDLKKMPLVRKLTNLWMSSQISGVCRQPIPDTQCGFRMIRRDLAQALCDTQTSRFDYETEMLVIASRKACRVASVPVSTVYGDEVSKIHPVRDTLKFLKLMRRLRRENRAAGF
jgi:glycosyltransferase involved in cell wall biosynthesis